MSPVRIATGISKLSDRLAAAIFVYCVAAGILVAAIATLPYASAQDTSGAAETLRFKGYPGAPEFDVVPRKDELFFFPCSQCHESMEPNPDIRPLDTMHDAEIDHGRGRIWCLSCHDFENRDYLSTLLGERVDFEQAYIVCGGCHASRQKDWTFGAHGKRVANWQGDRTLYNCTHCHNAHSPAIEPRAPQPAPPVRAGLTREDGEEHIEQQDASTKE